MKPYLIYSQPTQTIRQWPGNLLIAHRDQGYWICEPDLEADKFLAIRVFHELMDWDSKYGDGLKLLDRINSKKWKLKMWITLIRKSKINF